MNRLIYTYHAKRRMVKRKVTPEQVEEALATADSGQIKSLRWS